jgi:hypothetical protein
MAKGDGFLLDLQKRRAEMVVARNKLRRAEDEYSDAEWRFTEAVMRYNELLTMEPAEPPSLIPPIDIGPPEKGKK